MSKEKFTLSAPWLIYYKKLNALFEKDPDVQLFYGLTSNNIKICVTGDDLKADAIRRLLPKEKPFGNVTVTITVIPVDNDHVDTPALFERAFKGNPALSYIKNVSGSEVPFDTYYVVFAKEVVQFFDDDTSDVNGVCSTLYENIASEVFNVPGISFCTDIHEEENGKRVQSG